MESTTVIRPTTTARKGDTVVAIVDDGEATLKRYRKEQSTIILTPANNSMRTMEYPASRVEIRGVFVGVARTSV